MGDSLFYLDSLLPRVYTLQIKAGGKLPAACSYLKKRSLVER